jgi:hypothetical protein
MIDDMAPLIQAMDQMDAEDPTVAQAAKDRAAQILSEARLSFSKLAELIQQRRLLLQPAILARIKRMDQPGMLGDAAFRDTGSALRKEGQSFRQIAEAIEASGRPAPRYEGPVQPSEPLHQIASEPFYQMGGDPFYQMGSAPAPPAWLRALGLVARIVFFPLRRPMRFLAIALLAILLFYAFRGFVTLGQQVSGYFDRVAAVRHHADDAMSSVSSFVNERILRQSKEAPPTPPNPIPSASAPAPSPPSATPSAATATATAPPTLPAPILSPSAAAQPPLSATPSAPTATAAAPVATAPAPSANESASPALPSAAPAPPSVAPAGPPASMPRRDARGAPPSRSAANCGAPGEDRNSWSRRCAPPEDDRPRAFEGVMPEGIRRHSRVAAPCIGGIGGCYWGGDRY